MNWPRALAPFAAALAIVGILAAAGPWAPVLGPALVEVSALTPTDVEPGDRIDVAGAGFPAGKAARVTFRGTLHRPGEAPVNDAEIVATGAVVSPEHVDVEFREATQALFCGAGDRAEHTTFEGDVEVAFAAAAPGAAPIAGVLRRAVLDVRPSASAADRAREPEGQRVLAFVGLRVAPPTRRGLGIAVEGVDPGSRAEAAGFVAGDVLASFDGVRVTALGDLVPAPGEREVNVGVRTAGAVAEVLRPLSVAGLGGAPPAAFFGSAMLVVAALAFLLLFASPGPSSLGAAIQRAAGRLRVRATVTNDAGPRTQGVGRPERNDRGSSSTWTRIANAVFASSVRQTFPPVSGSLSAPLIVDALVAALFAVLPFGQYLVAARLDVGLLFVAAATSLATAAVVGGRSAWEGLRGAAHVGWQHVPAALAVASVVLTTGSLRVQEIDRAQGGWPWDWLAFRSPAALLALMLLLGCGLIEPDLEGAPLSGPGAHAESDASRTRRARGPWLDAACRAHRFIVAGLASALFLGGWALPGLSPAQQDGRLWLELAGAACLLAKTAALVLALCVVRWALPARALLERSWRTARKGVPLALVAVAFSMVWTWWSPERASQLLVSGSLVAIVTLAAVALAQRLRHGLLAAGSDGHLSPFL